jgi:hypothetical protein
VSASLGTSGGVELTEELLDRLAAEAEQGYDVERLQERTVQPPNPPPAAGPRVTG